MPDIHVDGMDCAHCVHAVTEAVSALPGVSAVSVDLASGLVRFEGQPDPAALRAAIEDEGYTLR